MSLSSELINAIHQLCSRLNRKLNIMEVCGTHTVSIFRHGIRSVLPQQIRLISGPGCPVCVTSIKDIDKAIHYSLQKNIIMTTYGDMMRVPGSKDNLETIRAKGADIRIVYSPLDSVKIAKAEPSKEVVFFAAGFETTSPSTAGAMHEALREGISNFYVFSVHKTVPPAIDALLNSEDINIDAFILPGHVCTITGSKAFSFISQKYKRPAVVAGFDAIDILTTVFMILKQIASANAITEIQYSSVVTEHGNSKAMLFVDKFFEPTESNWRGIGNIAGSGLKIRNEFDKLDAEKKFHCDIADTAEPLGCQCGQILKGIKIPIECQLFAKACSPEHPIGACMVSTEGSCAAYYKYSASYGHQ